MESFVAYLLVPRTTSEYLMYLFLALDSIVVLVVLCMLFRLTLARLFMKRIKFVSERPNATKKILLLGDGTGIGIGASNDQDTIAGRLYKDFSHVSIINRSVSWYCTRNLIKILQEESSSVYDLIVLSVGGNDVWRMRSLSRLTRDVEEVLDYSKQITHGHVAVLVYTNIGVSPVFPAFIRSRMKKRALAVRKIFIEVARKKEITVTDFFPEEMIHEAVGRPGTYFALDGFYPSSDGYELWYKALKEHIVLEPVGRP